MPIDLNVLCRGLDPSNTTLIFGAGASIPSGGISGVQLADCLAKEYEINPTSSLPLDDIATIIERKYDRKSLYEKLRDLISPLNPARGILTVPDFDWKAIFTTNYDRTIEKSYERRNVPLKVYSSNFDFSSRDLPNSQYLYKFHGTIEKDISIGNQERLILTHQDYAHAREYREALYARLGDCLITSNVIIIGQSLQDPDLRSLVDEAIEIKDKRGAPGRIIILSYDADENQELVYEARGLDVCFGGIDEFFVELTKNSAPAQLLPGITSNPLDRARSIIPCTTIASEARANQAGNLSRLFNGSPANYADIMRGWTFDRDISDRLESQLATDEARIAFVLGTAGSGKTTAVSSTLSRLVDREIQCCEHFNDITLNSDAWINIDDELRRRKEIGILFF